MTTEPRPPFYARTFIVLVAMNVALYILQIVKGVDWVSPETTQMIEWGANLAPLTMSGEPWRLFTSMFLHIGFVHIALNMYMLLMCGPVVERAFGSVKFLLVYLFSGLFGSLASALWYAQHKKDSVSLVGTYIAHQSELQVVVAAGASGALMGIAGAFLARSLLLNAHHAASDPFKMRGAFAQTIGINLVMGFMSPGVDNACHIGGLLSGAVIGGALALAGDKRQRATRVGANLAVLGASATLLFYGATTQPSDELLELKGKIVGELDGMRQAETAELAKAARAEELQRDRKAAPAPVDEATAAGTLAPLGKASRAMVLSKDGKRMVLVGNGANFLSVMDLGTKKIMATVSHEPSRPVPADCGWHDCGKDLGAHAVALSPDEHFAYVSSMMDNDVSVVDLRQNKIVASIALEVAPRSIKVSGNGQRAYVLNTRSNSVAQLDLASNKAIGSPLVLQGGALQHSFFAPSDLWLANDDKELWVANPVTNALSVIDTATMKLKQELALGDENLFRGGFFFPKTATAWVVGFQGIDAINLKTKTTRKILSFCQQMEETHIAVNPENTLIALAAPARDYVRLVKVGTQATIGAYPVKGSIVGIRFSADGKQLYVLANENDDKGPPKQALAIIDINKTTNVADYVGQHGELACSGQ
jgi:rhomboid protease GluP